MKTALETTSSTRHPLGCPFQFKDSFVVLGIVSWKAFNSLKRKEDTVQ